MRRRLLGTLLVVALLGLSAGIARAIIGGQPDGNLHPYVGFEDNGVFSCSGTLLSPTVMLTAAHCFSDSTSTFGTDAVTGAPLVRVSFDPNLIDTPRDQRVWHFGTYYFDPAFTVGAKGGLPHFDTHDIAVIIFGTPGCRVPLGATGVPSCGAITGPATDGRYGALPTQNIVSTLRNGAQVDIVGYGVQSFVRGGGPCGGPCKPTDGDADTRFVGQTTLIASKDKLSDEFLKIRGNASKTCFGDSGGPNLLGATNVVLGITSFGTSPFCNGNGYSYRADTQQALAWLGAAVAAEGGSLSH